VRCAVLCSAPQTSKQSLILAQVDSDKKGYVKMDDVMRMMKKKLPKAQVDEVRLAWFRCRGFGVWEVLSVAK
jgi:hypothetical protein